MTTLAVGSHGESLTAKLRRVLESPYTEDGRTVADHVIDAIVEEILNHSGKYGFNAALLKEILADKDEEKGN